MSKILNQIFQRVNGVPWQTLQGQTLILQPKKKQAHELNEVASFIWQNLNGSLNGAEVIQLIADEFDSQSKDVEKDYLEFVSELESDGLIFCL